MKKISDVVIALGGNLGTPLFAFERALTNLQVEGTLRLKRTSSLYRSRPVGGVKEQPDFLNAAVRAETDLEPEELLRKLHLEERKEKRSREGPVGGPRTLDLDLVFYGSSVVNRGDPTNGTGSWIRVPHPRWKEREFVLAPLAELRGGGSSAGIAEEVNSCEQLLQDASRLWRQMGGERLLRSSHAPLRRVCALPCPREGDGYDDHECQRDKHEGGARGLYAPGARTLIMGILNLTPDSFSDGSPNASNPMHVLEKAKRMVEAGADILDLGGQSTRPGADPINAQEEARRLLPALDLVLRDEDLKGVPISVDTYLGDVARLACEAGVHAINDVGGGGFDPIDPVSAQVTREMDPDAPIPSSIWCVVAEAKGCPAYVMTHSRGFPLTMMQEARRLYYGEDRGGPARVVGDTLVRKAEAAMEMGLYPWRMLWDPGFGFSKNFDTNLSLLRTLGHVRGHMATNIPLQMAPMLVGISRKGFIGKMAGVMDATKRDIASHAAMVACIAGGADVMRVHDVQGAAQASRIADQLWKSQRRTLE